MSFIPSSMDRSTRSRSLALRSLSGAIFHVVQRVGGLRNALEHLLELGLTSRPSSSCRTLTVGSDAKTASSGWTGPSATEEHREITAAGRARPASH
jgi:hypothetical protein